MKNISQRNSFIRAAENENSLMLRYLPAFALLTFPLSILVEHVNFTSAAIFWSWTTVKALGYTSLLSYFYLLKFFWNQKGRPKLTFLQLYLLSGIGGALQGLVVSICIQGFGLENGISLISRPIAGFLIGATWLPINSVCMIAFYEYRMSRQHLIDRVSALDSIYFSQSGLAHSVRDLVEKEIKNKVTLSFNQARAKLDFSARETSPSAIPAQLLRELASVELRDLSHQLWAKSEEPKTVVKTKKFPILSHLKELYDIGLHMQPIDATIYLLASCSLLIPFALRENFNFKAFIVAIIFCLVFYLTLLLGDLLWRKNQEMGRMILPLRAIAAPGLAIISSALTLLYIAPGYSLKSPLLGVIVFCCLCGIGILLSIAKSALVGQPEIIQALAKTDVIKKISVNYANLEIVSVSREWAQFIHGELQSKLLAVANILESSQLINDLEAKQEAISKCQALLDSELVLPIIESRDLYQESIFRISEWQGLIDIEVDCQIRQDLPFVNIKRFGDALTETINNSVRHGGASKIQISMTLSSDGYLECKVLDDGKGLSKPQRIGLGSKILNSISNGDWSRVNREDGPGTRVHMRIPALELPLGGGGSSVG